MALSTSDLHFEVRDLIRVLFALASRTSLPYWLTIRTYSDSVFVVRPEGPLQWTSVYLLCALQYVV